MPSRGMPLWKEAPFVRLLPPLCLGVVLQWYVNLPRIVLLCGFVLATLWFIVLSFTGPYLVYRLYRLNGLVIFGMLLSLGGVLCSYADIRNNVGWIGHYYPGEHIYIAQIVEAPTEKPRSFKTTAVIKQVIVDGSLRQASGSVILYLQKDSSLPRIGYGNYILFRKALSLIPVNGNPGGFDYRAYCAKQGIYHQAYLQHADYALLPNANKNFAGALLNSTRTQVIRTLKKYIRDKKACGLAEALLIGYKNDLDKSLVQQYADTGVVHIIAISGLHIGLIYWMLNLVIGLVSTKKHNLLRLVAMLAGIWFFSLLAGGSPAVLRAAVMFSFIAVDGLHGRRASVYNALAASAFLLLCYNPLWLWDAGFQLSYLAVTGLVVYMNWLYFLVLVKNRVLDMLWKSAMVSVAAQVLTIPITLYYFHQFPNYFVLTNLVAVPLSSGIVLAEIALVLLGPLPVIAGPLGDLTGMAIRCMNDFIAYMGAMPYAAIRGIQLSLAEVSVLYLAIIFLSFWLSTGRRRFAWAVLCAACLFALFRAGYRREATLQHSLVVYNLPGQAISGWITGHTQHVIMPQSMHLPDSVLMYHLQPTTTHLQIRHTRRLLLSGRPVILRLDNKRVAFIHGVMPGRWRLPAGVNYVVVSANAGPAMISLPACQNLTIILDNSNLAASCRKWKRYCTQNQIRYHDVREKGAFILKLN